MLPTLKDTQGRVLGLDCPVRCFPRARASIVYLFWFLSLRLVVHVWLINTPALDWRHLLQRRGDPRLIGARVTALARVAGVAWMGPTRWRCDVILGRAENHIGDRFQLVVVVASFVPLGAQLDIDHPSGTAPHGLCQT